MRLRFLTVPRLFLSLSAILALSGISSGRAFADVFGRLRFSVKNAADEKPMAGAKITLHDTANVHPDTTLTTDAGGGATSAPLETRPWGITTEAENFQTDTRQVAPAGDAVTDVEVLLEPLQEKVITITGSRVLVRKNQPQDVTQRSQTFVKQFPVTAGNPQSMQRLVLSAPGFAKDSVNQAHPRGEHSATSIYINGFQLPGALQGRAGQVLVPDIIQNAEILTGGYAPEYGSETGAVLNLTLRSGTIRPFQEFTLDGGTFATYDGIFTFGGQAGAPLGPATVEGATARRFGYLVSLNGRTTKNALEPPQPDDQTAHNAGRSADLFGNFDYSLGSRDKLSLTLNTAPARTDVANRAGLPASFAPYGQGYGYSGLRDAQGNLPGADPTLLGGQTLPLPSQQAEHQDISQTDHNDFNLLNYRHAFSDRLTGLLSYGLTNSQLELHNRNPAVDLAALPVDNSIEFNPDLVRHSNDGEVAGSLTLTQGPHTFKVGGVLDTQTGNESYRLVPASQLALDALAGIDSRLAPAGTPQVDATGAPVLDALGNQVYTIDPNNTTVPTLQVHRSGYYRAGYVQDTWNVNRKLTANYGLRYDAYKQDQNLGQAPVSKTQLSPRVNLAYAVASRTIGRLSYDRLFIQPPLSQGAILGQAIQPETYNHYEGSIEHQIGSNQTAKLAYYYKDIRNQIDTGLLIPGTQIGAFTSVNLQKGGVHGLELSYDLTPRNNVGLGGYLAFTYSIAKPNGVDNTGAQVPEFNDHDQRRTFSSGVDYTWRNGALAAVDVYYGSGVASSALVDDKRTPYSVVNLRLLAPRSAPQSWVQLGIDVENLFDTRKVINFASGFSGTRFVQARRILLKATGSF